MFVHQQRSKPLYDINHIILVSPSPFASEEEWEEYRKKEEEFDEKNPNPSSTGQSSASP